MNRIQRILVPTDFGRASGRAVNAGFELAKALGASMTLVHAYDLPAYNYAVVPSFDIAALGAVASEEMSALVTKLNAAGLPVHAIVRPGAPRDEILSAADEARADLIVMGTHGRRGVARALLGSIAESIVQRARVPVMTVSAWPFANRRDAGIRIAAELSPLRESTPTVIAFSSGAAVVGAEVARAFGCMLDILLVEPLSAADGKVIGAICEEGTSVLDEGAVAEGGIPPKHVERAMARLRDTVTRLRGARWIGDMHGRTVVVPCDVAESPVVLAGMRALRKLGAHRLVVAVPSCTPGVANAIRAECGELDDFVCLDIADENLDAMSIYRDDSEPSDRAVAKLLSDVARAPAAHGKAP